MKRGRCLIGMAASSNDTNRPFPLKCWPMALVVFLRGVNVGGHKTFRPGILAQELKHHDVVNVGAAGTFVVRKPASQADLRAELRRRLPFETQVMIGHRSRPDEDGFSRSLRERTDSPGHRSFRQRPREATSRAAAPSHPASCGRRWILRISSRQKTDFVFGMYRRQMKAISYLGKIDAMFGVPVTTRNWNTFTAITKVLKSQVY